MLALIYISLAATLIAIVCIFAMRPIAVKLGLVDKPNDRKRHDGDIPLIGGPVIWLIVTIGSIFSPANFLWQFALVGLALVILGAIDDRRPLSPWFRLLCQSAIAAVLIVSQQLALHDIGLFHAIYNTEKLNLLHIALGIFAFLVSMNAFNFIDGIDGLSASMGLLAITHMNLAYNLIGLEQGPLVLFYSVLLIGALSGFLLFNLQVFNGRKIFLGDSGAMFIGMAIAFALLNSSQTNYQDVKAVPAALCLWMIALPLTDMTTIIIRRLLNGRSPMAPDRTHLHHILMHAGFSPRRTLLVMILSAMGAFWLGFAIYDIFGEAASIFGFFAFMSLYYFSVLRTKYLIDFFRD